MLQGKKSCRSAGRRCSLLRMRRTRAHHAVLPAYPPDPTMHLQAENIRGGRPLVNIDLRACRRILVVKLDHLGDWILCTPFLDNLRRNAPRAFIEWCGNALVVQPPSARPPCHRCCEASQHCILEITERGKRDVFEFVGNALRG
jgi:hypothetical protein